MNNKNIFSQEIMAVPVTVIMADQVATIMIIQEVALMARHKLLNIHVMAMGVVMAVVMAAVMAVDMTEMIT